MKPPVLILGCGYTGVRVARLMAGRGHQILAASRDPSGLDLPAGARRLRIDSADPSSLSALSGIEKGSLVLHSVPLVEVKGSLEDPTPRFLEHLGDRPSRVVYLSTTSVYGPTQDVDEHTPPAPRTERERLRLSAESAVQSGPWSSMILRPAAIYGPGRGIQVSLPRGEFRLAGDGSNWVSRIHVEDLATLTCEALVSEETGAWPVADLEPARSKNVAAFVAQLTGCPPPASRRAEELHHTRSANRSVDGSAVFRRLGVDLKFPSYRIGIPWSLGL